MKWGTKDELPLNEEGVKKLIVLTCGRLGSERMHACSATWLVQKSDNLDWLEKDNMVKVNDEGYYGKLNIGDNWFNIDRVVAWCYADEIVEDYENGGKEKDIA